MSLKNKVQTFHFVEKPTGPQAYPMFELYVTNQTLPEIELLLVVNRQSYSILIHKKTGDHIYDHTKGARFLGEPLELNIESLGTSSTYFFTL